MGTHLSDVGYKRKSESGIDEGVRVGNKGCAIGVEEIGSVKDVVPIGNRLLKPPIVPVKNKVVDVVANEVGSDTGGYREGEGGDKQGVADDCPYGGVFQDSTYGSIISQAAA